MNNSRISIALALCLATTALFTAEARRLASPRDIVKLNSARHVNNHDRLIVNSSLDSTIFLYRGGEVFDGDDNTHHNNKDDDNIVNEEIHDANDEVVQEKQMDETTKIHVEATVSSQQQQHQQHPPQEQSSIVKKKSNAVGDPDGNSSDDEDSDDEDLLEELAEIERQKSLESSSSSNVAGGDDDEFDKLISMAERREGMKRKLHEMEVEMEWRREDTTAADQLEITVEQVVEEEEEGDDHSIDSSYSLAKEGITQDTVMKRQRKYKRGFMTTDRQKEEEVKVSTSIDATTLDRVLIEAFRPMLFLPPPSPRLPSPEGSASLKTIDIASRRRLDRRTLYHGLLAELGGSHSEEKSQSIRRRYLEGEVSRELRGALSLACQPKWRERVMVRPTETSFRKENATNAIEEDEDEYDESELPKDWYKGGVCLFPQLDEDESKKRELIHSNGQQQQYGPQQMGMEGQQQGGSFFGDFNNNEEGYTPQQSSPPKPWRCTMSMQETLAMALAHSLSCGLALIDDEVLASVRERVQQSLVELAQKDVERIAPPTINPEELRNGALIRHLIRLANNGKISLCGHDESTSKTAFGKVSDRMERDMELDLDDSNDDLAVESLRLMKEDEKYWYECQEVEENKRPLPLLLFLRSDSAPAILRSKSAVETLAHESVKKDSIHLFVLGGKGIDASTTSLPDDSPVGVASSRMHKQQPSRGKAFSMMSNFPPGSPEFNAQMANSHGGKPLPPGAFNVNNINASGVNDPDGSRRFNIFLARTVDQTGKPQIMGTIAPPQVKALPTK